MANLALPWKLPGYGLPVLRRGIAQALEVLDMERLVQAPMCPDAGEVFLGSVDIQQGIHLVPWQ